MSIAASTIIESAFRKTNIYGPLQTIESGDQALALGELNDIIGLWRAQKCFIPYQSLVSFAFVTSKTAYTIGESGADFNTKRPIRIEAANLIRVADNPNSRVPLRVIEIDLFNRIPVQAQSGPEPQAVYYKATVPNGTLYPWPYPENTVTAVLNKLELQVWADLTSFATAATTVDLADGYEQALKLTLAVKLAYIYHAELPPRLETEAREARSVIMANNEDMAIVSACDSGLPSVR